MILLLCSVTCYVSPWLRLVASGVLFWLSAAALQHVCSVLPPAGGEHLSGPHLPAVPPSPPDPQTLLGDLATLAIRPYWDISQNNITFLPQQLLKILNNCGLIWLKRVSPPDGFWSAPASERLDSTWHWLTPQSLLFLSSWELTSAFH